MICRCVQDIKPFIVMDVLEKAQAMERAGISIIHLEVLEKARIGITPGIDFGARGEGYVRFSYANSLENIAEGLHRLDRYLQHRPRP
jgi:bifunctional pyridoxal-dependent enzyme with beta-cystathionase and maltose regulon repressor activities